MVNQGQTSDEVPPPWFLRYLADQENRQREAEERTQRQEKEARQRQQNEEQKRITNGNKPGKALPALPEFHGETHKLDAWLQQAQVKILVDYQDCTEYVKFWALTGCLRGKAMQRMDAWTRQNGTPALASADIFFAQIEGVFKDPQAKERAARKLAALRQGNRAFLDTFVEWQSLVIESGGADWPDSAKKISLDQVLSDELAHAMIAAPTTDTFGRYCETLKEVDDRLRAYKLRSSSRAKTSIPPAEHDQNWREGARTYREPPTDKMDWQSTNAKTSSTRARRAQWVDQQELDRRHKAGLCRRCGGSGHFIRECPHLPPRRPQQASTIRQKTEEGEPRLENEGAEDTESGKE